MGATTESENKGPVTNCVRCDRWVAGPGPKVCDNCAEEGYALCEHCNERLANDTTPYCDVCAEEIVGGG
jgi:hypothetical protein